MKRISFWMLIVVACSQKDKSANLSPIDFKNELASSSGFVLVDVRTPEELQTGYLPGAHNLDFKNENFKRFFESADKENVYYVYCASGVRSGKAATMLKDLGFTKVYTLNGGLNAWRESGLNVSSARILPPGFTIEETGQSLIVKNEDSIIAQLTCDEAINNYCLTYRVSVGFDPLSPDGVPNAFHSKQEALDWVMKNLPTQRAPAP